VSCFIPFSGFWRVSTIVRCMSTSPQ